LELGGTKSYSTIRYWMLTDFSKGTKKNGRQFAAIISCLIFFDLLFTVVSPARKPVAL
jgi:hypothetical protein